MTAMQDGKFLRIPRVEVEKSTPEPIVDLTKEAFERKSQRGGSRRREQRSRADSLSRGLKRRGENLAVESRPYGDSFQYTSKFPELASGPSSVAAQQAFQPHAFSFLRQLFGTDVSHTPDIESELIAEVARQGNSVSKRGKKSGSENATPGVTTRSSVNDKENGGLSAGL